uniref:NADH-ubiquinone oxidoreductase chain 4L n=1 Tax=Anthrenus verbasci TaxID=295669 RepID=A0A343C231_9COLE|nr:NADH dehydrogenase subunit 4L [Anthrenus museorum]ARH54074.1 NADH dehydrogenase subunit 4L [Anthrenus verbasci]UQJ73831.1 NADH dehydrogenase subunit 4L [Anthrenus museorum]
MFFCMFFSGLISFCLKRKHLLLMLLSLEFVILSLFSFLIYFLLFYGLECYFSMIFVSLSVGEGALGLAILVLMVRTHGSDQVGVFSMLW